MFFDEMYVMKIQSKLSLKTNNYQIDSINIKILKKSQFMVSKSLFSRLPNFLAFQTSVDYNSITF